MRRSRGSYYYGSNISFVDMLFNIIMVFVLLFFVSWLLVHPDNKKNDVESRAEIMVTMTWPDNDPNDMDLWIKTPDELHIGYLNTENSYIHLERDDRGALNNFTIREEHKEVIPTRREVLVFRGKENGRFVVNVNLYAIKNDDGVTLLTKEKLDEPLPIHVELIQINPSYSILAVKDFTVQTFKEEKTAFAFIIEDGKITEIDKDINEPFLTEVITSHP